MGSYSKCPTLGCPQGAGSPDGRMILGVCPGLDLLHRGEVVKHAVTDDAGFYRFSVLLTAKRIAYRTRFNGSTLPGGDACPAVTSPAWWIYSPR
jgi:hypothetical protein